MPEHDPDALTDSDLMPISSEFKGKPLRDVPDWWWKWFLRQLWCDKYPKLVQYANNVDFDDADD